MKFLALLILSMIVASGCAYRNGPGRVQKSSCNAHALDASNKKFRVLCLGKPNTLRDSVELLSAAEASRVCPSRHETESSSFSENSNFHGTAIWADSYQAVIVCKSL
jgi:hypothetical protein